MQVVDSMIGRIFILIVDGKAGISNRLSWRSAACAVLHHESNLGKGRRLACVGGKAIAASYGRRTISTKPETQ